MKDLKQIANQKARRAAGVLAAALGGLVLSLGGARAADAGRAVPSKEAWRDAPRAAVTPAEIDRLIRGELDRDQVKPAPLTTDEQFIRRVTLDLTGRLPVPADVQEFAADKDPKKRAKLIDALLDGDEFARHWARYWRDVLASRATDFRGRLLARHFENWMAEQIQANKSWADVARAMITAEGEVLFAEPDKNGAAYFLAAYTGADAPNERAAETARVFLGIQLQCAQCHNHPFDQWKREQFHELAAYYARLRERPVRDGQRLTGLRLLSLPGGEHQMPSKEDPRKTVTTHPRFLDGQAPGENLNDKARRQALADAVVDKENYWFSAAYVNRVWGELMGQSFYQPVDDMGPQKEAVLPAVLNRLAASFRAGDYDTKALFRVALNTEAYQRQTRLGESAEQHLRFAASYPTRLGAEALWESLVGVLGTLGRPGDGGRPGPGAGRPGFRPGLEAMFKAEFAFDPSTKADEVEGSIPQALLLMNNPVFNDRIQAKGTNLLARILTAYPQDDEAIRMVYLRTLARKPTDKELEKCRGYVKKVGNRAEAFEDILWALVNSTEFQTKR